MWPFFRDEPLYSWERYGQVTAQHTAALGRDTL